jgi:PAS domain S-box-containing protein
VSDEQAILVVDDDAISRHVLGQALKRAGLEHEVVRSGDEALEWLKTRVPSLVLLDLMMPQPDGYAVLGAVRADPRTEDVPVVVLTALDADEEVSRAFDEGADDFVRKPFRTAELVARIRSQLRLRGYVDELARRESDARVVLELTQALASATDFRTTLYQVVRRIADVARVERCNIVLGHPEEPIGYVVAASDDATLRDLPIELASYPEIRQVMQTREPLVVSEATEQPPPEGGGAPIVDGAAPPAPAGPAPAGSGWSGPGVPSPRRAVFPIVFEDRSLGVLFLRGSASRPFADHELWLARTVANATAIAVRNARVLQQLRDTARQSTYARFEAESRLEAVKPYAEFFNSSSEGIAVVDEGGRILFCNPRAATIVGATEQELHGKNLQSLLAAPDVDRFEALLVPFAAAPRAAEPVTVDLTLAAPCEEEEVPRILELTAGPLHHDAPGAALLTMRDVTRERITAVELVKTKEFLERVIEHSVDAIISADLEGTVLLFNPAAERAYGYAARDVIGKMNVRALYPTGEAESIMRLIRSDDGGAGRLSGHRTEMLGKTGERIPVSLSAALIFERGKPIGSVGIFTDLRERLRMEARLTEAREELRSREKQALIAELAGAAAHELNQPLTSVLGYAEIIARKTARAMPVDAETAIIVREAERMAEIVRKIGRITKYETKSYVGAAKIIDLDRSSVDPNEGLR